MIGEGGWGDRLRVRIAASGMTNVDLAAKLKVSRARVGELCSRSSPPKISTVLRLADAIGCEPADLDERIAGNDSVPVPGSRVAKAAAILERKFKLRVEFVRHSGGHYMVCRKPGDTLDAVPTAIVAGPNSEGGWGCLSESKLQLKVFDALNGHA